MATQLIITCDDCGLTEGINQKTIDLYKNGIITNASILANFPSTKHALATCSNYPGIGLGIHLNLTEGYPLTSIPLKSGLIDSGGRFKSKLNLFRRLYGFDSQISSLIVNELTAQIEVFTNYGVTPQHITTHEHFHPFPIMRRIVVELAQKFKVSWIRTESFRSVVTPIRFFLPSKPMMSDVKRKEPKRPDYIVSLKYWYKSMPARLLSVIETLPGTVEIVVHPSSHPNDVWPDSVRRIRDRRKLETMYIGQFVETLMSKQYNNIQLVSSLS